MINIMNNEMTNKYINNIKDFDYSKNFSDTKKIIYEFLLSLINKYFNGIYFKYYILISIIILFYLIYYFVYDIISYKFLFALDITSLNQKLALKELFYRNQKVLILIKFLLQKYLDQYH